MSDTMETDTQTVGAAATTLESMSSTAVHSAIVQKQIIDAALETSMSIPRLVYVKAITFEELVIFLRGVDLVNRFKAFFAMLLEVTKPEAAPSQRVNWRVVLAVYMVVVRPTHVFEIDGPVERILLRAGVSLVETIESILDTLAASPTRLLEDLPAQLGADFHDRLAGYLVAFGAWQRPDMERLKTRLRDTLAMMYRACNSIEDGEDEDGREVSMEALQAQITLLETQMRRLCAGSDAVINELKAAVGGQKSMETCAVFEDEQQDDREPIVHYMIMWCTPFRYLCDGPSGSKKEGLVIDAATLRFDGDKSVFESMQAQMAADPATFEHFFCVFPVLIRNIHHIDSSCQINDYVNTVDMQKAATDGVLNMAEVVRRLLDVALVIKPLHKDGFEASFNDTWAVLHGELVDGNLDPVDAPAWIARTLEFFCRQIRMLCLDAGNKRFAKLLPVMAEHGIGYARCKFENKFPVGTPLPNTKEWLAGVMARGIEETGFSISIQDLETENKYPEFIAVAVLDLLSRPPTAELPEILALDAVLIEWMREELDRLQRLAAMDWLVLHPIQEGGLTEEFSHAPSATIESLSEQILDPASPIRQMTKDRIFRFLLEAAMGSSTPHVLESPYVDIMAIVHEELKDLAYRFERMLTVNRAIHTPVYNRVIAELLAEARAEMDTSGSLQ